MNTLNVGDYLLHRLHQAAVSATCSACPATITCNFSISVIDHPGITLGGLRK